MRQATMIAACVLLAGCANTSWVREDTSRSQFERDLAQCELEARARLAGGSRTTVNVDDEQSQRNTAGTVGHSLGYAWGYDTGRNIRVNRMRDLCMKANGYREPTAANARAFTAE